MKILLTIVMLFCLLAACGESAESAQVTETAADSPDPVEPIEEALEEEIIAFSTLEDYSSIASREQLVASFEEDCLVHGESWFAEGTVMFENTALTNPDNGQVILFLWDENGNAHSIQADHYLLDENYTVTASQEVSSSTGVFTGMSLEELREWNEADFDFMGMGWDYEGGITAEPGSRLANNPVQIELTFDQQMEIPAEYHCLYGDVVLNTADESVAGAPVLVGRLTWRPE